MEKKPSPIKKLGKLIVMTSTTLLDTFFSDDADKKNQTEKLREVRRLLQEAATAKYLVVLQVKAEKLGEFETVTGWIVGKTVAKEQVVLKLQNNRQQLRIIPLHQILKVSTLNTKPSAKKRIDKQEEAVNE
ncbi:MULTISPECIES: hypothetical protein [unclassified Enterococcus]|jgi:hypothetical protein|uniref:hypothetical protein n=1 Tax=unclassified Enterococcus TaxID=2608891 RepID=UPI0006B8C6E5|nr:MULTISPECIES: hypothetical protein [unclassified Enterococcus]KPG70489.1 hypothetical protein AEQ18_07920 [Enterococcus sp. RIT-PI-f]HCE12485.1 hypothetical protein [Enterococcus sp.]